MYTNDNDEWWAKKAMAFVWRAFSTISTTLTAISYTVNSIMMSETAAVLRFVKLTDKAMSPVKGSAKAAGFDLRRYTFILMDTFLF
jgi:hypothetical protein